MKDAVVGSRHIVHQDIAAAFGKAEEVTGKGLERMKKEK